MFLLHTNDLPANIQGATLVLFADDINLPVIEKDESSLHQRIKKVVREWESWFYKNSLFTHMEKTIAVSFHTTQNRNPLKPQITFNNTDICYKSELKFLGIYITEKPRQEGVDSYKKVVEEREEWRKHCP